MNNITHLTRPLCTTCNKNLPGFSIRKDGSRSYRKLCTGCCAFKNHGRRNANKKQYHKPGREYLRYRKDHCEECGFVAKHLCQLDVDHVDANRQNNELSNLRTLCANCHRLKTQVNKDNYAKQWRAA